MKLQTLSHVRLAVMMTLGALTLTGAQVAHATTPDLTHHQIFISHTGAYRMDALLYVSAQTSPGHFNGTLTANDSSVPASITITEPQTGYYQMTVTTGNTFAMTTYQGALSVNGSYADFFTGSRSYSGYYIWGTSLISYIYGPLPFCATGNLILK